MPCEEHPHPLPHGGTSQPERVLSAADAAYVQADERSIAHRIVGAARLSRHLAFVRADGAATGDWQTFFGGGETALLALLAVQDVDAYRRSIAERFSTLRNEDESDATRKSALGALFSAMLSLSSALDNYRARLPQNAAFRPVLDGVITTSLRPVLKSALRYFKAATSAGLLTDAALDGWMVLDAPVQPAADLIATGLSALWTDSNADWSAYYAGLSEDDSIFGTTSWNDARRLSQAGGHNLFTALFDRYLTAYARLARESSTALEKSLDGDGTQQPHYALLLTFLRLFRHAQDGLNAFGRRHLDHYYRDVLRLKLKPAQPDSAHLLIELAKGIEETSLQKDTLFRGGKDSAGTEILYGLDEEAVVNRARVAQLSGVYRGHSGDGTANNGRLYYASSIASADGLGAELKPEGADWHPFALRNATGALIMPKAEVGFAVASHHLLLAEGERIILVKLSTTSGDLPASAALDCYLTTEKGWHLVTNATLVNASITDEATASTCRAVQVVLSGAVPAIVGWSEKVHGGRFATTDPVLKVVLRNADGMAYGYDALAGIALRGVEVEVRVGVNASGTTTADGGLKSLQAISDFGPLNTAKSSQPFGTEPKKGAALIIGSEEAFSKKNLHFQLRASWAGKPDSGDIDWEASGTAEGDIAPKATMQYLGSGTWKSLSASSLDIFGGTAATHTFPPSRTALPTDGLLPANGPLAPFNTASRAGFLRFSLLESFGHEAWRTAYVLHQATAATATPKPDPQAPPWTPTMTGLSLHYTAAVFSALTSLDAAAFTSRGVRFYHLHPGGEAEQHARLTSAPISLLPRFVDTSSGSANAGEFYIGLENLIGGQGVTLLVQVQEGTTDPLIAKPDNHLQWSYLAGNVWKTFPSATVTDGTAGFIRSGLVEVAVPEDARTDNTLLQPGLLWLRASIGSEPGAVARLLAVAANAVKVSLRGEAYAPDLLAAPRAAGSIAKLKVSRAEVKKVLQPYASFGGRVEEAAEAFYPRVAERLRHRDRAISLWDYEHLVLEAFPAVHRAKCLPHSSFAGSVYRENAPGHVTLVTIPSLEGRKEANPLRPYTHEDTLQSIREFLSPRMTGQATLHVTHPQFEEVELGFKLALMPGLEFNFYKKRLQEEIVQALSPWAFDMNAEVAFGSRIRKSVLIDFIEERPYVDFITDVNLYGIVEGVRSGDVDEVVASTARSILVSVPAAQHSIVAAAAAASAPPPPPCVDTYFPIPQ